MYASRYSLSRHINGRFSSLGRELKKEYEKSWSVVVGCVGGGGLVEGNEVRARPWGLRGRETGRGHQQQQQQQSEFEIIHYDDPTISRFPSL